MTNIEKQLVGFGYAFGIQWSARKGYGYCPIAKVYMNGEIVWQCDSGTRHLYPQVYRCSRKYKQELARLKDELAEEERKLAVCNENTHIQWNIKHNIQVLRERVESIENMQIIRN